MAAIVDLTFDETLCQLLRWWCNHPWIEPLPIVDRLLELGMDDTAKWFRLYWLNMIAVSKYKYAKRRLRQRFLKLFRQQMVGNFGDFTKWGHPVMIF